MLWDYRHYIWCLAAGQFCGRSFTMFVSFFADIMNSKDDSTHFCLTPDCMMNDSEFPAFVLTGCFRIRFCIS